MFTLKNFRNFEEKLMQHLSKLAISLFLVLTLTFTAVVKPATALELDKFDEYTQAISDIYSENNEQTELHKTVKKVGQTVAAIVSATAASAGLSGGAGIMSGLASAGAVMGGGAVAGIGVLGAGPTAVTTMVIDEVLKDNENLSNGEREARAVGRTMTNVGATAATLGTASAIATAGSVAGVSAAGITSGLAAIGATVGGGMAAGAAITIAAPAVGAAAVGYGSYEIWKWLSKD